MRDTPPTIIPPKDKPTPKQIGDAKSNAGGTPGALAVEHVSSSSDIDDSPDGGNGAGIEHDSSSAQIEISATSLSSWKVIEAGDRVKE